MQVFFDVDFRPDQKLGCKWRGGGVWVQRVVVNNENCEPFLLQLVGRITKNKKKNVNKNDHTYVGVENCRQVSEIYSPIYDVAVRDCKILKRMRNWLVRSVCRLVGRSVIGQSVFKNF